MIDSCIGVRRETKNKWERRVPLIPSHVRNLYQKGVEVCVQPSSKRIHTDAEYQHAQATIKQNLSECPMVIGVKEMPLEAFEQNGNYMFFSHTHKAQSYNMPMLKRMLELDCSLIDYELITDDSGHRLIAFGRFAGLASAIDSLWAMGKRYEAEGFRTPLLGIDPAWQYESLDEAKRAVAEAGRKIGNTGLHPELPAMTCVIAGTGNSARGAREILELLPTKEMTIEQIARNAPEVQSHLFVNVAMFGREQLVRRQDGSPYSADEYRTQPELYESRLVECLQSVDLLIHTIYWEPQFPRLVPLDLLETLWSQHEPPRLKLISDVSCDIHGSVEATVAPTTPDKPTFLWKAKEREAEDLWTGEGPLIMAVDNLPCELPREASEEFSRALEPFVPALLKAIDDQGRLDVDALPSELARAVIACNGQLRDEFAFLKDHLP